MVTGSLKERLLAKYQFLFDAFDQVRAGKRLSKDENAALQARYASVAQGVLAKKAEDYQLELLASGVLLSHVLQPDLGGEGCSNRKSNPGPRGQTQIWL